MADNPISPNRKPQNSMVKRKHRWLASEEEHEQFKRDFAPELILTFPSLSGPVIKPHKNADEGDN
jgi:hypothetical protein